MKNLIKKALCRLHLCGLHMDNKAIAFAPFTETKLRCNLCGREWWD